MIVDTSVLVAILLREADAEAFARAIDSAEVARISAGSYLETATVVDRVAAPRIGPLLDELIHEAGLRIEPFTSAQAKIAREAYRQFGKSSGHPAQLNFGDCFAYALAMELREPLLFKGTDFGKTDVKLAKVGVGD